MSGDTPRPVWITHADVSLVHTGDKDALARLADGFNRAPADALGAAADAYLADYQHESTRYVSIMRALGYPGLAPDTKEDTT